ncbi:hypothetical protein C8A05DRAFT_32980 [Staphylotrichum tortipilum]|uniref:Uncharacterized protein n=1 Tax=Staphylotrichum tortipilum TaxID=2831512 RepID=A0AAN6RTW9_9PEZI|nr:hypothetical protein C8A05DRAFT_32980 [Staphylotrichum longicolle]
MAGLTTAGPCPPKAMCTVVGGGQLHHWVAKTWVEQPKTTGTVVVVQIVNTVLGTTRFSTIQENVPSAFVPPLTNAAGTKIAKTTYVRRGTTLTATLTYPTPRLFFDETFRIQGDYLLRGTSGSRCVIGANQTWDMLAEPQPSWGYGTKWDLSEDFDPSDPLGWNHGFNEGSADSNPVGMDDLIDLLPDDNPSMPHSVVKSCSYENLVAPYVLKPESNWRVVARTSVIYEGNDIDRRS